MMKFIMETGISIDWLKEKLLENTKSTDDAQLNSWSAKIISENIGYASMMVQVALEWSKNEEGNLPNSVVMKCPVSHKIESLGSDILPADGNMFDEIEKGIPLIHKTECNFYTLWGQERAPITIPRCYAAQKVSDNQPGVLIFEDLSKLLSHQSVGHGVTEKQLSQIIDNLSDLHAWCLSHSGWENEFSPEGAMTVLNKVPQTCKSMFEKLKLEFSPQYLDPKMMDVMIEESLKPDAFRFFFRLHEQMKMPPVLVHGDMWIGNVLFKKSVESDGPSDDLLAICDWQLSFAGCVSCDFAWLACSSMTPEMRREKFPAIMQQYYATLKQKLGRDPPFPFDTLKKSYRRALKGSFFGLFGMLGLVLTNEKQAGIYGGLQYRESQLHRLQCLLEDTVASLGDE